MFTLSLFVYNDDLYARILLQKGGEHSPEDHLTLLLHTVL